MTTDTFRRYLDLCSKRERNEPLSTREALELQLYMEGVGPFCADKHRVAWQIEGTYGLVFVLSSTVSDSKVCLKTINPAKRLEFSGDLDSLFRRELRLWLSLPAHPHVLPALGLEFKQLPQRLEGQRERTPLAWMPYCEADLSDWVKKRDAVQRDMLIALAQVCSGLQWLYENGIQGHGDLKPANVLLQDLRKTSSSPATTPYWRARVTDLGWTDIWRDGGGTKHAWRPYLAPERFENDFVPQSSDVYALGVIACELLTGVHPAGEQTCVLERKWNDD